MTRTLTYVVVLAVGLSGCQAMHPIDNPIPVYPPVVVNGLLID